MVIYPCVRVYRSFCSVQFANGERTIAALVAVEDALYWNGDVDICVGYIGEVHEGESWLAFI